MTTPTDFWTLLHLLLEQQGSCSRHWELYEVSCYIENNTAEENHPEHILVNMDTCLNPEGKLMPTDCYTGLWLATTQQSTWLAENIKQWTLEWTNTCHGLQAAVLFYRHLLQYPRPWWVHLTLELAIQHINLAAVILMEIWFTGLHNPSPKPHFNEFCSAYWRLLIENGPNNVWKLNVR